MYHPLFVGMFVLLYHVSSSPSLLFVLKRRLCFFFDKQFSIHRLFQLNQLVQYSIHHLIHYYYCFPSHYLLVVYNLILGWNLMNEYRRQRV
jgi:hypothetical protein